MMAASLEAHLRAYAGEDPLRNDVAETIWQLARAALKLRTLVAEEPQQTPAAANRINGGGDEQQWLDIEADRIFIEAARNCKIATLLSEEQDNVLELSNTGTLALAIDPLDGSSNIDINAPIGTIFSLLPLAEQPGAGPQASFLQTGRSQLAAGIFVFGQRCLFILTLGAGCNIFVYSQAFGGFVEQRHAVFIPEKTAEFAINASNYRHWDEELRLYIDDCLAGADGPREKDFNMRWLAAVAGDVLRILTRGGVYLYPGDQRRGYKSGRLRLLYEANPIAMIVEQAGGAATDGRVNLLDIQPEAIHQHIPVVFGSVREVQRIARYLTDPSAIGERSPLFGRRSLFRA
ncbi:class 1 fructose-bisphosphatase [Aureimonas fodinaquatilis]|uniref:Fructose-1,6-bisphosphatase class 1 n=1 Tax=Aureimonas fodinaquatilis TaxID=2565783 RepID=A0A5B0E3D4_9HYPH|nr:class 1 fructose-bisphosphatase [Aureimonas fodinaquatilis]KAA0972270.1 class 1 fructose-bisphosphatase [Aureimonas fodinaquatilis]